MRDGVAPGDADAPGRFLLRRTAASLPGGAAAERRALGQAASPNGAGNPTKDSRDAAIEMGK